MAVVASERLPYAYPWGGGYEATTTVPHNVKSMFQQVNNRPQMPCCWPLEG